MKISVVIPSRNRETCLNALLDDLERQELKAFEVIVVDQSDVAYSMGGTATFLRDGALGPARARNIGALAAEGDILAFLDDDCRIQPDFLGELCKPICEMGYSASTGAICDDTWKYQRDGGMCWNDNNAFWILSLTANPKCPGEGLTLSFAAGCSAVRRDVFESIGGFDTFFDPDGAGEDREFALRLFHAGYPIHYNGGAKVQHIGEKIGGRRSLPAAKDALHPLERNMLYVAAKYFNWHVFNELCLETALRWVAGAPRIHPGSWIHALRRLADTVRWMNRIRSMKRNGLGGTNPELINACGDIDDRRHRCA